MKMKAMKRLSSILLALVMMLAMAMTVSATEPTSSEGTDTPKGSYTMKINTVANHTYKIYQLATGDVSSDGKKLSNIKAGKNAISGTEDTQIEALKDKTGEELGNAALALIDTTSTPAATVVAEKDSESGEMIVASVTLEGGYYVIVDSYTDKENVAEGDSISRTMVELVEDTTVTPKTVQITPDKKIVENDELVDTNEASIGDTITYRLMGTVADMAGYENFKYVMVDTLSKGLTVNYEVGRELTGKYGDKDAKFQVTSVVKNDNETTTIRIALVNAIQYKKQEPDNTVGSVYVDIQATLNENADFVSTGSNDNKMKIEFSNDPSYEYDGKPDFGDEPKGTTTEPEVKTYTTYLTITKTDEEGTILTGAKFKLTGENVNFGYVINREYKLLEDIEEEYDGTVYYELTDGTYTETAPKGDDDENYKSNKPYGLVEEKVIATPEGGNISAEAFVDAEGKVTFFGLGVGNYTISETVTPDGYNTIADIKFSVTWSEENGFKVEVTEGEGQISDSNGVLTTTIVNHSGTTLPSTGGIGTTIFYVVGGILVVGAVVLLVVKKRMSHQA